MWLSWKSTYYDSQCGWKYGTVFKLYFKCMGCFTSMHVWASHACGVLRLEDDLRFPGTGGTFIYEQPCECYKLNFNPLEEQIALNYWVFSPDPGTKVTSDLAYRIVFFIYETHIQLQTMGICKHQHFFFHLILAFCFVLWDKFTCISSCSQTHCISNASFDAWSFWFNWTLFIFYFLLGIYKFMCIYVLLEFLFCMI